MAILASVIIDRLKAALDAEGSDYYTTDRDYLPAIRYAQEELVRLAGEKQGSNKFVEEALRELRYVRVFQTNNYSRIQIPQTITMNGSATYKIFALDGVLPFPLTTPVVFPVTPADPFVSSMRTDCAFVSCSWDCKRLNAEEWSEKAQNPFLAGYNLPITQYAYLEMWNYSIDSPDDDNPIYPYDYNREIEISPLMQYKLCGLRFIINDIPVAADSDSCHFPLSVLNLILEFALLFIAVKQGDNTNVWNTSRQSLMDMIQNY